MKMIAVPYKKCFESTESQVIVPEPTNAEKKKNTSRWSRSMETTKPCLYVVIHPPYFVQDFDIRNPTHVPRFPDEIGNLTSLEDLDLDHFDIESLPSSIGKLVNLKELSLVGTETFRYLQEQNWKSDQLESFRNQ